MEESNLITSIKQEKVTPERELPPAPQEQVENQLDKILQSNLFGDDDKGGEDEKKNIEPTK